MAAQIDREFLTLWVRAELEAAGDAALIQPLIARALSEGLDQDEAELDASGQIAEQRGWLDRLELACGDLALAEVREARGQSERLEKSGGHSAIAFLRATPGVVERLILLGETLAQDPNARVAELTSPLGGTPGCSLR